MAKKKRRFSKKARAAALRNLAKARTARRRLKRGHKKHHVRGHARRNKRGGRSWVKAHRSYEEAAETPRKRRRAKRRKASSKRRASPRRSYKRRSKRSKASYRRAARRSVATRARRRKRHPSHASMGGVTYERRPRRRRAKRRRGSAKRRHVSHRRVSHRRRGAMENPLGMGEVIVGGLTGLVGYAAAEVLDRVLATHALTTKTDGTFSDPMDANGHWNSTNILAPMSIGRWAAGLGMGLVPIMGAKYIGGPKTRAALGFFGFGALVRVLGKGATDGVAYLTRKSSLGQRLFILEDSAQAATKAGYDTTVAGIAPGPTALAGLPFGVGAPCGCPNCQTGIGACCRGGSTNTLPPMQPAGSTSITASQPPPLQASAPPPPPPPPPAQTGGYNPNDPRTWGNAAPASGAGRPFPSAPHAPSSGHAGFIGKPPGVGASPERKYNWGSDD